MLSEKTSYTLFKSVDKTESPESLEHKHMRKRDMYKERRTFANLLLSMVESVKCQASDDVNMNVEI